MLRAFHRAFPEQMLRARQVSEWIKAKMPKQVPLPEDSHASMMGRLDEVVRFTWAILPNPQELTAEACLGMALARYLSWDQERIGRACLHLCYAAMKEANVPLTQVLEHLLGDTR